MAEMGRPESPHRHESLLATMRQTALELTTATTPPPTALRLRAGDVELALEWLAERATAPETGPPTESAELTEPGDPAPAPDEDAIRSPMVGTFYAAPEPGASPFVTVGDPVEEGQQVCIIEAMKLMNPIEADRAGRVTAVLVADGAPVEYGQPLMTLAPDG